VLNYYQHLYHRHHIAKEVEGARTRGTPKRTWREVARKDCQAYNLNRKDATVRSRRRKLIKDD